MPYNIQATTSEGDRESILIDEYPNECPICHTSIHPVFLDTSICFAFQDYERVQSVFACTRNGCRRLFIATYATRFANEFELVGVEPIYPKPQGFPTEIKEVSPTFVEVYNQAMAAESAHLDQLSGIGLRKALEFLIKDFAIFQNPDDEEEIKSIFLGTCIKNYIDDPKIESSAKRATWLGNDETHYVRKWEDKDINDLKILIKLTVNWIESFLLTKQYEKEMP